MTCVGKKRFQTMEYAVKVVEQMRTTRSDGKNLQAYKCPICRNWHVGNVQGERSA